MIGFKVPLQADGKGDFAQVEDDALEESSLNLLLMTNSISETSAGELPWRQAFGVSLDRLRLQRNTVALGEVAKSRIADQVGRWMPHLNLKAVDVKADGTKQRIQLSVERSNTSSQRVNRHM